MARQGRWCSSIRLTLASVVLLAESGISPYSPQKDSPRVKLGFQVFRLEEGLSLVMNLSSSLKQRLRSSRSTIVCVSSSACCHALMRGRVSASAASQNLREFSAAHRYATQSMAVVFLRPLSFEHPAA